MDDFEVSVAALRRLLRPLDDGSVSLVVTYRRHDDYMAYEREIADLRAKCKRMDQDLAKWALMGNRYIESLDEIKYLKSVLDSYKISY